MKTFITLALLGLVNFRSLVSGNYYDITTVYKFNTLEESDPNGNIIKTYLNTCVVTVHPQTNAVDLPYYNYQDNVSNKTSQVLYPVKTPKIPSLDDLNYNTSSWKTLTSDGGQEELHSKTLEVENMFSKKSEKDIFTLLKFNSTFLGYASEFSEQRYEPIHTGAYSTMSIVDYFKYTYDISSVERQKNTFIHVKVFYYNAKDFSFILNMKENTLTISISKDSNEITVCSKIMACKSYHYQGDYEYQISVYIDLGPTLKIYDTIGQKIFRYGKIRHDQYDRYVKMEQSFYKSRTEYKFVQLSQNVLSDDQTIASPWIQNLNNGTSLIVSHYTKTNQKVKAYIKGESSENIIELESEDQRIPEKSSMEAYELVLTKFKVNFPKMWTMEKQIQIKAEEGVYISNIWESDNYQLYRIHEDKSCVKDNITEIYDVALEEPNIRNEVTTCFNGGLRDQDQGTCNCPPGFTGDACEIACGRNVFGQKCSKLCSRTGSDCKGMVLCTADYGCSCAPGYYGDQCLEQCSEGTYGADCKQTCGQCKSCDKYTGHCMGECYTPHVVWPYCKIPNSYWTASPVVVDSGFHSVKLSLDFNITNIENFSNMTLFYMVQYKEDGDKAWENESYEKFELGSTQYEVKNLKPGRKYFFRVLLIGDSLKESDPSLSEVSQGLTKCSVSKIMNNLNTTKITNHSITLVWKNETLRDDDTECPFTSYTLDIESEQEDNSMEKRKILNVNRNSIVLDFLSPVKTYSITLLKMTVHGESTAVSTVRVTTQDIIDSSLTVAGVSLEKVESTIKLKWFQSSVYKTYFIKFSLVRRLSCSKDKIPSALQVVSTSSTNYTLNLEPNAQYEIFVTGDESQQVSENTQTVITYGTIPNTFPNLLKQRFRVTNESVLLYWTDIPSSCLKMNGFFKKYVIDLLNSDNQIMNTLETDDKKMEITGLSPKTEYKVRVRYENHIGYNPLVYAEHIFTTKSTSFLTAQDLTAYKTSSNMIGIRWKIPENNSTITGINLKIQNHAENRSINISSPTSIQCKAWPSYVCYNITQLKQNTKYKVSVEIFSEEFPEGGSQKEIQAITRESAPSPVTDIKQSNISDTNITVSWRIPFMLNGLLRKFLIEVEHLSSYDESLCCQMISTINYVVTEDKEIYSHVIENIQNASSYQVTIRAFTKRLGQEAKKIIDIPPPILPLRLKPLVTLNGEEVVWEDERIGNNNDTSNGNELVSDILVIVLPAESAGDTNHTSPLDTELSHHLRSNAWWLAHICPVSQEECSVNIGSNEGTDSPYGKVNNKPLTPGHNYTIAVVQINKYLSARSYTIAKSAQIKTRESITDITTMDTLVSTTPQYLTTELPDTKLNENIVNEDNVEEQTDTGNVEEVVTEDPDLDYYS